MENIQNGSQELGIHLISVQIVTGSEEATRDLDPKLIKDCVTYLEHAFIGKPDELAAKSEAQSFRPILEEIRRKMNMKHDEYELFISNTPFQNEMLKTKNHPTKQRP